MVALKKTLKTKQPNCQGICGNKHKQCTAKLKLYMKSIKSKWKTVCFFLNGYFMSMDVLFEFQYGFSKEAIHV